MINISKKAIMTLTGCAAALVAASTVLANALIKSDNGNTGKINPLNRDKNFHYYSLTNKMSTNKKLSNLIDFSKTDKQMVYFINEQKFLSNFKSIIQDTLKQIPTFSANYLNYQIDCHYKIKDTKSIMVDLVWYEPGAKAKFYDQFQLVLQTC